MKKRTILVVEDDGYIADVLKSLLEANDYRVLSATSGKGALQLAASHVPVVVLLDLGLPDIDGTHVLTSLREWYEGPVIIVSARNQEKRRYRRSTWAQTITSTNPSAPQSCLRASALHCARRTRSPQAPLPPK